MVATWYTYLNGEQVWLVGAGPADGDSARLPLSITRVGQFPPAFDPASVVLEPWSDALRQRGSSGRGRFRVMAAVAWIWCGCRRCWGVDVDEGVVGWDTARHRRQDERRPWI